MKLADSLYDGTTSDITLRDLRNIARSLPNRPTARPIPLNKGTQYAVLHELLIAWKRLEKYTRFSWRATSYIRESPSHRRAVSLDVAPNITERSWKHYSVSRLSDPVLYKRQALIRRIQKLCRRETPTMDVDVGFYIEPDHIHIQIFQKEQSVPRYRVIKFGITKACYPDSEQRSQLPLIRGEAPYQPETGPQH